jgi:ferredoxin-type protein NapF
MHFLCCLCRRLQQPAPCSARAAQPPWSLRAAIGERCLAAKQIECRICGDYCLAGAIRFVPRVGGVSLPVVDTARCTGCAACFAPCPTQAIRIRDIDDKNVIALAGK